MIINCKERELSQQLGKTCETKLNAFWECGFEKSFEDANAMENSCIHPNKGLSAVALLY